LTHPLLIVQFTPIARAEGDVKDATNQQIVRFEYGLPTANEIYGWTLEVTDLYGFWLRSEYDVNRRHRRFPNPNRQIIKHNPTTAKAEAYYATLQRLFYPWYAYGEVFSIDPDYPYRRDHRGYNAYLGVEVARGVRATVGYLNEKLVSSSRKSRSVYCMLTSTQDIPSVGIWRIFEYYRSVRDNIPENLELFDVSGRRVRTLHDDPGRSGSYELGWDGLDEDGNRVAPGLYLCRIAVEGDAQAESQTRVVGIAY
jgi:flagellar hook capping protein FlgD